MTQVIYPKYHKGSVSVFNKDVPSILKQAPLDYSMAIKRAGACHRDLLNPQNSNYEFVILVEDNSTRIFERIHGEGTTETIVWFNYEAGTFPEIDKAIQKSYYYYVLRRSDDFRDLKSVLSNMFRTIFPKENAESLGTEYAYDIIDKVAEKLTLTEDKNLEAKLRDAEDAVRIASQN